MRESQARDCGVLDGTGTSANDPRQREEATALGTEHLDSILFDFDELELSFENERISSPEIESPVTSRMRRRRSLARNGLVSDFRIPDHESEVDGEIASVGMPDIDDSEPEDEISSNPRCGHVKRQVETTEAAELDKDDVTEGDSRDPFYHPPCHRPRIARSGQLDSSLRGRTADRPIGRSGTADFGWPEASQSTRELPTKSCPGDSSRAR